MDSCFLKWIVKRGVKYEIDDVIITGRYRHLPLFSQIKTVIAKNQSIHFFSRKPENGRVFVAQKLL